MTDDEFEQVWGNVADPKLAFRSAIEDVISLRAEVERLGKLAGGIIVALSAYDQYLAKLYEEKLKAEAGQTEVEG